VIPVDNIAAWYVAIRGSSRGWKEERRGRSRENISVEGGYSVPIEATVYHPRARVSVALAVVCQIKWHQILLTLRISHSSSFKIFIYRDVRTRQ
jgi:hypothetical protein